ncbi:pyridoxamine 5'-phosphate oxidase family protein [Haloplasma contractile]|uniref:Uncharacterized protein n=1 Tax=Haloplasma contractile SSD-17B TaxID=1033810 RepID=U2EDR1_9MOLU|nr:pyridoxamine 5'-phosphate oxidase family protein [Haloplasma contractile]ERJ13123.1 hypothetical protein HLPCO_000742 [Haloplasma contractile SSD-17B]
MKDFGLLKLKAGEKLRTMNYTTKRENNKVYVLTLVTSNKIEDIKEDSNVTVTLIQDKNTVDAVANIVDDRDEVKAIFDQMIEEDNSHFKTLNDQIVMIELMIK